MIKLKKNLFKKSFKSNVTKLKQFIISQNKFSF